MTKIFLIGSDDVELLRLWNMLEFNGDSDYEIKILDSYDSAVAEAEQGSPDICLIDYDVITDGEFNSIQSWKAARVDAPSLLLIDKGSDEIIDFLIDSGFDDCLIKDQITAFTLDKSIKLCIKRYRTTGSLSSEQADYQKIVDNSDDAIMVVRDGLILYANFTLRLLSGLTQDELSNLEITEFIHPDDHHKLLSEHESYLQGKKIPTKIKLRFIDRSNDPKWISLNNLIINWLGQPAVLCYIKEASGDSISDLEQYQIEAKYKTLFENANDGIILLRDGKSIDCNPRALEIFRCSREQMIDVCPADFSPEFQPDGRNSVESMMEKVNGAFNGIPQVFEWRHVRPDKTEFDASISLNTIELGSQTFVMSIVRDITQYKMAERLMRENEEKFRTIYNNAQVGMFKSRVSDGLILECNDRFAQIFGYRYAEEVLKISLVEQGQYLDEGTRERMLFELKTTGEVKNYEARFKCADGQIKWVRFSARLTAKNSCMEGIAADITLEKRTFDMLRKSNQQVRNILESISDGFFTLDNKLKITFINRAAERILNRKSNEVLGKNIFLTLPEFCGEELEREFQRVLRAKTASSIETNLNAEVGAEWYEIRIYPSEGGLSVYFSEITARKRFEQMLLDEERKMHSILMTAAEGILIVDENGEIETFNPAAERIFGSDHSNLNKHKISNLIPNFFTEITRLLKSDNSVIDRKISNLELTGRRLDGSTFPLKLSVSEMTLIDQKWHTVIVHDLTDEREQMSRLMEMDKFSAIGTLAAGVAHEFKNYLAGIIGNASFGLEYMDNQDGSELAREALEQVINIGENANRVALSLLTYSRNNYDEKSREDLNALIEEVLTIVAKETRAANVEIQTSLNTIPKQNIYSGRFQQMILNLILNAKQAIDTRGIIRISTSQQDDQIVIKVEDNGCGISAENLNRIFDPFYSTKGVWGPHKDNGAGLGLSICRNIVLEHNGEILVDSKVDEGTSFTILLPLQRTNINQTSKIIIMNRSNIAMFSTNEETLQFFREYSHKANTEFFACNSISDLDEIRKDHLLVVLDADFPGMGELYRIGQFCKQGEIKFIIVNSGKYAEHQLEDLFKDASNVIEGLPTINSMMTV